MKEVGNIDLILYRLGYLSVWFWRQVYLGMSYVHLEVTLSNRYIYTCHNRIKTVSSILYGLDTSDLYATLTSHRDSQKSTPIVITSSLPTFPRSDTLNAPSTYIPHCRDRLPRQRIMAYLHFIPTSPLRTNDIRSSLSRSHKPSTDIEYHRETVDRPQTSIDHTANSGDRGCPHSPDRSTRLYTSHAGSDIRYGTDKTCSSQSSWVGGPDGREISIGGWVLREL